MGPTANELSWSFGPRTSRPIRGVLYIATSLMFGSIVYLLGDFVIFNVTTVTQNGAVGVGAVVLFVVFLLLLSRWVAVLPSVVKWAEEHPPSHVHEEWLETVEWSWVGIGGMLVAAGLGAIHLWLWGTDWLYAESDLLTWSALGFGLTFGMVAHLVSSAGRVDLERMELDYADRHRVDLASLVAARRVTVGERTYLWVTFEAGVRPSLPRVYLLSTAVVDQVWPTLQQQFERPPTDGAPVETASRGNVLAAAVMFAIAIAFALVATRAGAPLDVVVVLASYFVVFGIAALLAEAFAM